MNIDFLTGIIVGAVGATVILSAIIGIIVIICNRRNDKYKGEHER